MRSDERREGTHGTMSTPKDNEIVGATKARWSDLIDQEDWWSIWIGMVMLWFVFGGVLNDVPSVPKWAWGAFDPDVFVQPLKGLSVLALGMGAFYTIALTSIRPDDARAFFPGFLLLFAGAAVVNMVSNEATMHHYGIGYAFWAIFLGMLISNTIGTPKWLLPAVRTEFYIKTGLVLLGAEVLFGNIVQFGYYGILIAWGVTPVVIVFMWLFGTRVLKMVNKPLVIVIATATSVCGVSAAIAAAAASRAKREDLTIAVGMSLLFTVMMMIFMPVIISGIGLSPMIGGAWMGGTIDATGAVVAAGAALGPEAEKAAAVVKMIQNILIGVVAFAIAVYWVSNVERDKDAQSPGIGEIWNRLPKFILGFLAASLITSFYMTNTIGEEAVDTMLKETKVFRGWLFCLAFLSIGLESNFKEMTKYLDGGKPVVLYLVGQSFNIILTLLVAYLVLSGIIFPAPPPFVTLGQ